MCHLYIFYTKVCLKSYNFIGNNMQKKSWIVYLYFEIQSTVFFKVRYQTATISSNCGVLVMAAICEMGKNKPSSFGFPRWAPLNGETQGNASLGLARWCEERSRDRSLPKALPGKVKLLEHSEMHFKAPVAICSRALGLPALASASLCLNSVIPQSLAASSSFQLASGYFCFISTNPELE